jgi:DNA uptake protein ComE-like DNA-binding protein
LGMTSFILVASSKSQGDWQMNVGTAMALTLMALGTAHAFAIRRRLIEPGGRSQYRPEFVSQQEQALAEARTELQRRSEARQILRADPELARQLCIGRPDLPRRYRDGGLVDANHAPATALEALPGINASLADGIVTTRDTVGGFNDLTDMSITLGITPQTLDEAEEFLVFPKHSASGADRTSG